MGSAIVAPTEMVPGELDHPSPEFAGDLASAIHTPCIHDYDLIEDPDRRPEAMRQVLLLGATLGELHRSAGDAARARWHFEAVRRKTTSPFDRELIDPRLAQCV